MENNINDDADILDDENGSTNNTTLHLSIYDNKFVIHLILLSNIIGGIINICIIFVILCFRNYRRPANYLLVYLAFSSIIAIFWTAIYPFEKSKGKDWYQIPYFCEFMTFIRRLPQPMMSFTTVLIALDRKRFMKNHLARPSSLIYVKQMIIVFFVSLLLSIPRWFERKYDPGYLGIASKCKKVLIVDNEWLTIAYNSVHLLCTYICPTIILCREIWLSKTIIRCLFSETDRHFILEDKRAQFIITVCLFSLGFIICWPQHGIFYFLVNLPIKMIGQEQKNQLERYWFYSRAIYHAYISINPTLPLVLCFDWQWTTIVQLIRKKPTTATQTMQHSRQHRQQLLSPHSPDGTNNKELIELRRKNTLSNLKAQDGSF